MTAKEYLGQAYAIDRRVRIELEKVRAMRAVLDYKPPNLQGSGGSGSAGMPEHLTRVMEYEQRVNKLVGELVSRKLDIERTIDKVTDLRQEKGRCGGSDGLESGEQADGHNAQRLL